MSASLNQPTPNPFPGMLMLLGSVVLIVGIGWFCRPAAVIAFGVFLLGLGFIGRSQ